MADATSFLYAASSRHAWRSLSSISPATCTTVTSRAITAFSSCNRFYSSIAVDVSPLMD